MNLPQASARLGASLSAGDWTRARAAVSEPGRMNGSVVYARPGQSYSGPVLFLTDTHLVQRVGKTTAVAHDLRIMRNGPEIGQAFEAMKPNLAAPRLLVRYDSDKAQAQVKPLTPEELAEVKRQAQAWAERSITNPKTREDFVRQLEGFVSDASGRRGVDPFQLPATQFARALVQQSTGSAATAGSQALERIEDRDRRHTDLRLQLSREASAAAGIPGPRNALRDFHYAPEALAVTTAQLWARLDAADYRRLASDTERRSAAIAMDNKSQRYQDALQALAPDVAAEIRHHQLREMQLVIAKEDRKREELTRSAASAAQGSRQTQQREVQRGVER